MKRQHHKWTVEEDDFLIVNYPDMGSVKVHKTFCKKYGYVSYKSLQSRCTCKLKLRVSDKRWSDIAKASSERQYRNPTRPSVPVGYVNKKSGMVKTTNGWTRLGRMLNVPKGSYAVHLNNDVTDNRPENIAIISKRTSMKMTSYRFWSQNEQITKTGIMCCELEDLLNVHKAEVSSSEGTTEDMEGVTI